MKRIVATFYRTKTGRQPAQEWLAKLDKLDRMTIGKDIAAVEFGWPIGMPICRHLRDGLLEVRSTIRNGRVEARTYFAIEGGTMLLLHCEEGKSGQQDAIKLAIERLQDFRTRRLAEEKRKR